jgi:hypothetical protein
MRRELSVRALDGHPSALDDTRPGPAASSRVQAALAELRRGRPVPGPAGADVLLVDPVCAP